jgi:hypothetical protein
MKFQHHYQEQIIPQNGYFRILLIIHILHQKKNIFIQCYQENKIIMLNMNTNHYIQSIRITQNNLFTANKYDNKESILF